MKEQILKDFKSKKGDLEHFKSLMINLIKNLVEKEKVVLHQIVGRLKDSNSLSNKIEKKGDKYRQLSDITDLVGLRIITYLESEVDIIAEILKKEFETDEENSIDKRILKNDQFGYRSLHIVLSLSAERIKFSEYSKFAFFKCEIQIRSILQHAWAEIEHDLGYKGVNIPDDFKRTFNRLAALLETADLEFVKLKSQLTDYEKNISKLIEAKPEDVDINKTSIGSFMQMDPIVSEIRNHIVAETGYELRKSTNFNLVITILKYFNLTTIQVLQKTLIEDKSSYLDFLTHYIAIRDFRRVLNENTILIYFGHYLVLKGGNLSELENYLMIFGPENVDEITQDLLKAYQNSNGY
ncbi:GTP pyrophosphokinase family protein [Mucilaginibacter sp. OK283]|jgi:ppGpp synthetase/RelA/SpoT-type nucleotidyltranferase|uniref:GTP pyrophosphokinase n=1 Tax=Mucilaginibacter sp. OK283 TaxID=1881049 RepID=UPI0008D58136|nr:hypothetical protein [Mucilaginibacter sp. OK283]SEO47626.1 ppGpp synthetase catalytic domain-containing protein (RelA/SpoT-type nucleotidyltranferase) [Mucilaginibacter sp. OK283]